jgi:hypothetical protein
MTVADRVETVTPGCVRRRSRHVRLGADCGATEEPLGEP